MASNGRCSLLTVTDIKQFEEDDTDLRRARLCKFARPIEGLEEDTKQDQILQHWGVWVEFGDTRQGEGLTIYTFDGNATDQYAGSGNQLFGNFGVEVSLFYPDKNRNKIQSIF